MTRPQIFTGRKSTLEADCIEGLGGCGGRVIQFCRDQEMGKSRKQGRNKGKISKSHKDRQRNEKNKAAAAAAPSPAATSVSKENENYDSHDLETVAAFKVSLTDTYTYPKWTSHDVSGAAYTQLSWGPPRILNSSSHDFETMAALGISVVCTHMFPRYDGPPIKNGADKLESWAALGNPYIH
ncbi:hypothetical protein OROGR_001777 [Orobanche gracilis]